MKRQIDPFKLGLFVLSGVAIVLGGLLWIGAAHFFERTKSYVTFFDQSVRGLSPGTSIDHLGIQIGRVSSLSLSQDGRLVRVVMKINPAFKVKADEAIEIKMAGITGGHYLAIVKAPQNLEQVTPKISFPTQYPLIPSARGTITQIEDALENVLTKLQSIHAQKFLASWAEVAQNLSTILSKKNVEKDIDETLNNVKEASAAVKTLLTGINRPETIKEVDAAIADFSAAASDARKAAGSASRQIEAIPPHSLASIAERMDKAAKETEQAVTSLSSQADQVMSLIQQSAHQLNQDLADLRGLVESLRQEPGRIFEQPSGSEPFGR